MLPHLIFSEYVMKWWMLIEWVLITAGYLTGLAISAYVLIMHEDYRKGHMQPSALSEFLNNYVWYEYRVSWVIWYVVIMPDYFSNWWFLPFASAIALYNLLQFINKKHKWHFITADEYKNHF